MASPDMDDYSVDSPCEMPSTPMSFVDSDHPPQRKKRKAWGQPIPEFEKLIGPRKRAKTEAEKTQRAHERTLRNRRAAAQSRDKKQAQFAAMEDEMLKLKDQLALYQARFGSLSNEPLPAPTTEKEQTPTLTFHSYPTPDPLFQSERPSEPLEAPPTLSSCPVLSQETPLPSQIHPSLTLAPTLQLDADTFQSHIPIPDEHASAPALVSDLPDATQYSAAVLLDPQCLSSAKSFHQSRVTVSNISFQLLFHLVNLTTLMTTHETFSNSMTSPLNQILRILAGDWGMPWTCLNGLDQHFQQIYCLITTPMKGTTRPVFRTKLLSRFLACNPITARLITVAADRALQLQASEGLSLETPEGCQRWAELMTFRWTIQWLEKEHDKVRETRRMRKGSLKNASLEPGFGNQRVAYRSVEKSAWRWERESWEPVEVF